MVGALSSVGVQGNSEKPRNIASHRLDLPQECRRRQDVSTICCVAASLPKFFVMYSRKMSGGNLFVWGWKGKSI